MNFHSAPKTQQQQTPNTEPTAPANSCSVRPMFRLPVTLKLYDADMKEHEYGPIIVEIPHEVASNFNHPGDYINTIEKAALEYLVPDMSCGCIEGLMRSKPNARISGANH